MLISTLATLLPLLLAANALPFKSVRVVSNKMAEKVTHLPSPPHVLSQMNSSNETPLLVQTGSN